MCDILLFLNITLTTRHFAAKKGIAKGVSPEAI